MNKAEIFATFNKRNFKSLRAETRGLSRMREAMDAQEIHTTLFVLIFAAIGIPCAMVIIAMLRHSLGLELSMVFAFGLGALWLFATVALIRAFKDR